MSVYGYGRGSISKAAEDALKSWCSNREQQSATAKPTIPGEATTRQNDKADSGINPDERIRDPTGAGAKNSLGSNNSS